jgi:hypothetical protein
MTRDFREEFKKKQAWTVPEDASAFEVTMPTLLPVDLLLLASVIVLMCIAKSIGHCFSAHTICYSCCVVLFANSVGWIWGGSVTSRDQSISF